MLRGEKGRDLVLGRFEEPRGPPLARFFEPRLNDNHPEGLECPLGIQRGMPPNLFTCTRNL